MGKNAVVPVEFLNSFVKFYSLWDGSDLPGKHPDMNAECEKMFWMLADKLDAKKRREEYIKSLHGE